VIPEELNAVWAGRDLFTEPSDRSRRMQENRSLHFGRSLRHCHQSLVFEEAQASPQRCRSCIGRKTDAGEVVPFLRDDKSQFTRVQESRQEGNCG